MSEPYCLAMVLCDAVHQDPATGKKSILGTFSTVTARQYPATVNFCVYYAITDAQGQYQLRFRIVDSEHMFDDDNVPVLELPIDAYSPNPLSVCEGQLALGGAPLPRPGVYHCELLFGDDILMARRLVAIEPPNQSQVEA